MAPIISYAQRYEDMHLLRVFGEQAGGFYIDIGAGHPVYDNVSFTFYLRGWSGITAEPNLWLAQLSEAVRPRDSRTQSLVGEKPGEATYYLVEDFHGLSTTVEGHARKAQSEFGKSSRAMTVPVTTLRALCEQHAPAAIDFLKIDVEGAEREVLLGGDWRRFRPKVVVLEALAPVTMAPAWEAWEPLLTARDYRFALFRQSQPLLRRRGTRCPGRTPGRAAALVRRRHPFPTVQAGARRRLAPGPWPCPAARRTPTWCGCR